MARSILLATLVAGCTASTLTGISAEDLRCPPDSTLTYVNFGAPFLEDNCLSCHTSKQAPLLTTHSAVLANKAKILRAAVTSSEMPDDGSLRLEQRRLLGEWLTCGAP